MDLLSEVTLRHQHLSLPPLHPLQRQRLCQFSGACSRLLLHALAGEQSHLCLIVARLEGLVAIGQARHHGVLVKGSPFIADPQLLQALRTVTIWQTVLESFGVARPVGVLGLHQDAVVFTLFDSDGSLIDESRLSVVGPGLLLDGGRRVLRLTISGLAARNSPRKTPLLLVRPISVDGC